jgi:BlaI family penicillinase repressor
MKPLTKAEERVMQVLWRIEKGFLKEIIENSPDPKPHSNTIATVVNILVEKGYVEYETHGRNNLYWPRLSKDEYGKRIIDQLVKGYFEGSPAKLVSQFVGDNKLSVEELEAFLKQIRSSKNNQQ